MGGFGSGMWYREDAKQTTKRVPELDVRQVRRRGLIAPGQEELVVPGGVKIPLTWTSMPRGGTRPWFVCSSEADGCGRRVAILYLDNPRRVLLCRRCLDLVYESQREWPILRAKRRAEKARARLVAPGEDLPMKKPKHMHHRTFVRLGREYVRRHREHVALYNAWAAATRNARQERMFRLIEEMEAEKREFDL